MRHKWTVRLFAAFVGVLPALVQAQLTDYYIGIDSRQVISGGTYDGLPAPNFGRLTFLYAHIHETTAQSAFHPIGPYGYVGVPPAQQVTGTGHDDRVPEEPGQALPLLPGEGLYAGKLRTIVDRQREYAKLDIQSVASLRGFSPVSLPTRLLRSSDDRWSARLDGSVLALELVSVSSPALHIGTDSESDVLTRPGDRVNLGDGESSALSFKPVFWTEASAPAGNYSASFKLVDVRTGGTPLADSGVFTFVVSVPEPGTIGWLVPTATCLLRRRVRS